MSLKIFADHCVPNSVVNQLIFSGHQILKLRDFIAPDSPDPIVIKKAQELCAILLSLNGDFADIISYPPQNYIGIISLQLRNHPETIPIIMDRLLNFIDENHSMDFYQKKLLLVESYRIRIRS